MWCPGGGMSSSDSVVGSIVSACTGTATRKRCGTYKTKDRHHILSSNGTTFITGKRSGPTGLCSFKAILLKKSLPEAMILVLKAIKSDDSKTCGKRLYQGTWNRL